MNEKTVGSAEAGVSDEEEYEKKRRTTSRLFRFWCWLWYGHDRHEQGHTVNHCDRCGAEWAGHD